MIIKNIYLDVWAKAIQPDKDNLLTVGNMYEVEDIDMGQCNTTVKLKGFKNIIAGFYDNGEWHNCYGNSTMFKFYHKIKGEFKEIDIYRGGAFNNYRFVNNLFCYKVEE